MELTQEDFEARLSRVDDGTATDEDRRLLKHYRREGYSENEPADGSWLFADSAGERRVVGNNYGALSRPQLQRMARERGLPATGSQEELIARLREADEKDQQDKSSDDKE